MVLITLIGEKQARIGDRFYFMGSMTECRECRLRGVCFNLETGSLYEITALRDAVHECTVHEGTVRAVEVEKRPVTVAIPRKQAIDGSTITFESAKCRNIGCANRSICNPPSIRNGTKLRIADVGDDAECPCGLSLVFVKLI